MVVLPFSESLELCAGGAPPTADDMLEGSDASGEGEDVVMAVETEDRPCAARFIQSERNLSVLRDFL